MVKEKGITCMFLVDVVCGHMGNCGRRGLEARSLRGRSSVWLQGRPRTDEGTLTIGAVQCQVIGNILGRGLPPRAGSLTWWTGEDVNRLRAGVVTFDILSMSWLCSMVAGVT